MLQVGSLLESRFKVKKKLEPGGMGEIFKGKDEKLGKECVLKVPLITGKHDDVKRDKLNIEAKFLSEVNHPNIVDYLDHFQYKGEPCLAITYLEGETLFKRVSKPFQEASARKMLRKIMDTIEYMHNKGAIYRDLKPKNIILSNDDVTLIDFGLVKKTGNYTTPRLKPGTVAGSPIWTAPEQLQKGYAGPQSDVFAIGTTTYYMLTGQEPPNPITSPLNLKSVSGVQVSDRLANIVYQATKLKPQSRFSSVGEMREALEGEVKQGPRLVVDGHTEVPLKTRKTQIIGRKGNPKLGPEDIGIEDSDPQSNYISRRHAKLYFNRRNQLIVEDMDSLNGTWLLVKNNWRRIEPGNPWKLPNGSMLAFAYDPDKGPYVTATVKGL